MNHKIKSVVNRFRLPLAFLLEASNNCNKRKYREWYSKIENQGSIRNTPSGLWVFGGSAALLAAVFGTGAYKYRESQLGTFLKWMAVGSIGAGTGVGFGTLSNRINFPKSEEAKAFEKVQEVKPIKTKRVTIDRKPVETVECKANIPRDMWDPKIHGDCDFLITGDKNSKYKSLKSRDELEKTISALKQDPELREAAKDVRTDVVTINKLPHYRYKAKAGDHEFDILIPKIYADHRPKFLENIFKAIQFSLSTIPPGFVGLVKKIQLHLGEWYSPNTEMKADEDGSISIFHNSFNFKDPKARLLKKETDRQNFLLYGLLPDTTDIRIGDGNISSCILHHEIGHLVEYYLRKHCLNAELPKDIFPENSELRKKQLFVDENFTEGEIPREIVFPNDPKSRVLALALYEKQILNSLVKEKDATEDNNNAWTEIAKADNTFLSVYGLKSNEDFAESFAAFLKAFNTKNDRHQQARAKRLFPNRYAFLLHCCRYLESMKKGVQP